MEEEDGGVIRKPYQYIFMVYQIVVLPFLIREMYRFWKNREVKPINGRFPGWTLVSAIGCVSFQFFISMAEIFHFTMPCGFVVFHSQTNVGIASDAVAIRGFLLYFKFNLSLQNMMRATKKLKQMQGDEQDGKRVRRKTSLYLNNFFTRNRHKMDRWAIYYFVIATLLRFSGTVIFFTTTSDINITNLDCTGKDPGRENADLISLIMFGMFFVLFVILAILNKNVTDGLDIKKELRNLAILYFFGILVWFGFLSIPELLEIEKNIFPIPPAWLCLVCLLVFYMQIVRPRKATREYKYSLLDQLEEMSKEDRAAEVVADRRRDNEIKAREKKTQKSRCPSCFSSNKNDGSEDNLSDANSSDMENWDDGKTYWEGPTPGARIVKPDTLDRAFRALIDDPRGSRSFTSFLQLEFAVENIFFLQATNIYYNQHLKLGELIFERKYQSQALEYAQELEQEFVSSDSPMTCNLKSQNKIYIETTIREWEQTLASEESKTGSKYEEAKWKGTVSKETRLQFLIQSEDAPHRLSRDDVLEESVEMKEMKHESQAITPDFQLQENHLDVGKLHENSKSSRGSNYEDPAEHALVTLFHGSNKEIFTLLKRDSFRRYLKSEHYDHFIKRRKGVPLWEGDKIIKKKKIESGNMV